MPSNLLPHVPYLDQEIGSRNLLPNLDQKNGLELFFIIFLQHGILIIHGLRGSWSWLRRMELEYAIIQL